MRSNCNLGVALERQDRHTEALSCYRRALALRPDYAEAHFNRAHALLITGELEEGWKECEWRFAVARYDRNFGRPLWSGGALGGQNILLHTEQGFGDTLQFLRYVPTVAARGGRVILEVPEPLVRLARSVEGASQVAAAGEPLPDFAWNCPLLSLPRVLGTNLATIPNAVPYLSPPAAAAAAWAERIGGASGPRVGLVWAGTTIGALDLRQLDPLWDVAGISWQSSGRRPVLRAGITEGREPCRSLSLVKRFRRNRRRGLSSRPGDRRRHRRCASGGRSGAADMGDVAGLARFAVAVRPPTQPLVSNYAMVSTEESGHWLGVAREIAAALAQVALWRQPPQPGTSVPEIQPSA